MTKKHDSRKVQKPVDETGKGKQVEKARYQKPKVVKVKGPRPDYTPKPGHEIERKRQALAQEIATERARFPMFCEGVVGSYLIGRNFDNGNESVYVTVKMAKGKSGEFRVIERDDGIFIPHVWLFIPLDKCHFAFGYIGGEQHSTLSFLQGVLRLEIKEAKHRRWEEQQSAQATVSVPKATETPVKEKPAETAEVLPIQDAIWQRDCRPITDLVKNECLGVYSAPDEKGQLILELRAGKFGHEFVVKKITPEHHLSAHLVHGSVIKVDFAARTDPEFDQHIRALLEMSGVRLGAVKSRRDTHAHVTEGMPNVREETQLAA
jgi:hypothetical protein